MDRLYHGKDYKNQEEFEYNRVWGVRKFKGSHPKTMSQWIEDNENNIDILALKLKFQPKFLGHYLSDLIEDITGQRVFEYRNYKLI